MEEQLMATRKLLRLALIADVLDVEIEGIEDKVSTHVQYGYSTRRPWRTTNYVITVDGSTTVVPLTEVPHELWPQDMLKEYKRAG
jgi:hypothetical protein